ncbi:MAG: hypothetical protein JWM11_2706 [Planctomycetaceae bacterium]|nr:hypothetical protein [Planctomycetaceae bacterium]
MKAGISLRRKVRLVAIGAMLTAASLLLVCLYGHSIHQFESPGGPVEQWIKKGCDLRRLNQEEDGGVYTRDEYKSKRQRLVQEEDAIVSHNDFPGDMAQVARYEKARYTSPAWVFPLWIAFAVSLMTAIGAISWLEGASFGAIDPGPATEELS